MTTSISNTDNIIDSRDIEKRIEDLEDQLVNRWVAGWNMPGYLPDSEPAEFDNFVDAQHYIADEIETEANDLVDGEESGMYQGMMESANHIRWRLDEGDFGETIGKYHYWITQDGQMGLDEDDLQELKALKELKEEAEGYCDWKYGATLINDDYFTEYAQELAEDIGAIDRNAPWPNDHIDWEAAVDALKMDYTSVDFDGTTYWVRS